MSRNKEKAQSLLNQLHEKRAMDLGYVNINKLRRPRNVSRVNDLQTAEKWRAQVNGEINSKVTRLYDEMISEYQIRDLNDEVNKLFREKTAWEYRIKELGGPNYLKFSGQGAKNEFNVGNYRYFGRAKELKEVKQLMEIKAQEAKAATRSETSEMELFNKKTVYEKLNTIGADYYGFYDDTDGQDAIVEDVDEDALEILGQNYVLNNSKHAIMKDHSLKVNDSLPQDHTAHSDTLYDAETALSTQLLQNYSQTLQNSTFEEPSEFLEAVSSLNLSSVPSITDTEKFLVDRKRQIMLESLGL